MKTALLMIAMLAPSVALARIGETAKECTARYGAPVRTDAANGSAAYRKADIEILCKFTAGKCSRIEFQHILPLKAKTPSKITADEMDEIIMVNGGGSLKVIVPPAVPSDAASRIGAFVGGGRSVGTRWKNNEGTLVASLDPDRLKLVVEVTDSAPQVKKPKGF